MPPSYMWTSVLQVTFLAGLAEIISNHLMSNAMNSVPEDFKYLVAGPNNTTTFAVSHDPGSSNEMRNFYLKDLPRAIFSVAVLAVPNYHWHLWMERMLPTRANGSPVPVSHEKIEMEGSEDAEEKIVQKWIAQGKIRRSSISWANSIGKSLLDLIVGNLWRCMLWILLERVTHFSPLNEYFKNFKEGVFFAAIACVFSPASLASFVGFIIIPAYRRIVFEQGIDLVFKTFFGAFLGVFVPWLMNLPFMQEAIRNATLATNATMNGTLEREL